MSIYVGNLSYKVTDSDLNEVFAEYVTVKTVHTPTGPDKGSKRVFSCIKT